MEVGVDGVGGDGDFVFRNFEEFLKFVFRKFRDSTEVICFFGLSSGGLVIEF